METTFKPGKVIEVSYPFSKETLSLLDGDGFADFETWRPGCIVNNYGDGDTEYCAEGMGKMVLTVVSTHKPGKYPERVFYTRQWIDPDGKTFGKGKLHNRSKAQFSKLCKGYRHSFYLNDEWTPGAKQC